MPVGQEGEGGGSGWAVRRREVLAGAAMTGLASMASAAPLGLNPGARGSGFEAVSAAFDQPPREAGLGAYWYWLGGAMTREGVTADLEAMHANGITTAMLFAIGASGRTPLVSPPADALTPAWWALVDHAVAEADRLGMTVSLNMCDGWATASGPWITPDLSMQLVTWSETRAHAGDADIRLPTPPHQRDYYRDTAVFAFPWPESFDASSAALRPHVTTDLPLMAGAEPGWMLDPDNRRDLFDTTAPGHIDFGFDRPFTLRSVTVRTPSPYGYAPGVYRAANSLEVQASDDGHTFRSVGWLEYPKHGWQTDLTTLTHALPETTARTFRFLHHPARPEPYREDYDFGEDLRLRLFSLELSSRPDIHQISGKSAAQWSIARRTTSRDVPPAACVDPAQAIDLTKQLRPDGTLDWTPPQGRWRVLRLGYTTSGKENSAAGGAQGLEVDRFNPAAVKLQFDRWFGAVLDKVGPERAGRVMNTVHVDSWEASGQNWSPGFLADFRRLRGFDLTPWLPVLAGVPMGSAEASEAVLHDLRRTVAELTQSAFFETVAALAHARGCTFSGEPASPTFAVDGLRWAEATDVPMGEFWLRTPRNDKPTDVADAVSGGRIYGKRVIATESFTQGLMAWDEHPGMMKPLGDRHYCRGINRFMLHVYAGQPFLDRAPAMTLNGIGSFFSRTQTWWKPGKAWFDYMRRCQAVLQQGRGVADIAAFIGEEIPSRALLPERLDSAVPEGLTFDSINRDALLRLARVEQGVIVLAGGARYRLLTLPAGGRYSCEFLRGLLRLLRAGATVCGSASQGPIGHGDDAAAHAGLVAQIWDGSDLRRIGAGRMFGDGDVAAAAARIGLTPDLTATGGAIDWTHRTGDGWDAYFIVNKHDRPIQPALSLRGSFASVERWNPDGGRRTRLSGWTRRGERSEGPLTLAPRESAILLCRASDGSAPPKEPLHPATTGRTLAGPWQLSFSGFHAPDARITLPEPALWSTLSPHDLRYHSGSGHYRTSLTLEAAALAPGRRLWLDLGTVREMAEVIVNGRLIATLWTPPFAADITGALRPGANSIELVVTNTWHNRLAADSALPDARRVTWVQPRLRKKQEWLPHADAPLIPSGLAGPVRLIETAA
ncbi:glycosyl hydrolase [Novosphingobium rosa]|uniref:glycosyl hydrolase n=1 Tax=Novosphingobium rosa TaxID=76978 RepID=UPI00082FEF57|nr:glycosyl hydrolase [Novosphingobium rosa]